MDLVSIPANPLPDHVVSGVVKTPDGVNLRFARWEPPPGRKGTVVVLQGRAEYIEKYFETALDLRARGFAVATFDWRGQGLSDRQLSDRRKGYVRSFEDYAVDLDIMMQQVVLPDCPPPIYALAHSMGAAVLLRACHAGRRWFDRVALSAPMIGLPLGIFSGVAAPFARFMRFAGRGSAYVPASDQRAAGTRIFAGNVFTSDPVRFARNLAVLEAEPRLALGPPTIAWADSALRAMNEFTAPGYAGSIRQPILMVAAGHDQVVSTPAIESFGTNLLAGSHLILAGSRHEILQEQDRYRQQFWAAFDAFVPGTPLY
ncbi:MAG TPA: alpha/beta hydrolase [Pseudolabrys sp.]|nr:alpha/beta hydrolase [Pseudolabrys sp.]